MSKSKKNKLVLTTMAATATALTAGAVATTAHADEMTSTPVDQQQTANSSDLAQAQSSVDSAQTANSQAQTDLNQANANLDQAANAQSQAQTAVDNAQVEVNQASDAAQQAKQNNQEATQENIDQQQAAIQNQTDLVNQAKQVTDDYQNQTNQAQSAVDQASQAQSSAQANLDSANAELTNAQDALNQFQQTKPVSQAPSEVTYTSVPDVKVPDDYAAEFDLKQINSNIYEANTKTPEGAQHMKESYEQAYQNREALTKNPIDDQDAVDIYHLTNAQTKEITTFAANLINNIRQQIASQPNGDTVAQGLLSVSDGASKIAQQIVDDAYNANNYAKENYMEHHSDGGIINNGNMTFEQAAYNHGIHTENNGLTTDNGQEYTLLGNFNGTGIRENLSGYRDLAPYIKNMSQLKSWVFQSIMSMTFADQSGYVPAGEKAGGFGGHTVTFLNPKQQTQINPKGHQFLTVTIDDGGMVHYFTFGDTDVKPDVYTKLNEGLVTPVGIETKTVKNDTKTETSPAIKEAQDKLTTAQNDLSQKQDALQTAQDNQTSAQNTVNDAQNAVNTAQDTLTKAQSQTTGQSVTDPASFGITTTASQAAKDAVGKINNGGSWNSLSNDEKLAIANGISVNYQPTNSQLNTVIANASEFLKSANDLKTYYQNLSDADKITLNNFYAALINSMRQALGVNTSAVYANSKIMDLAQTANSANDLNAESQTFLDHSEGLMSVTLLSNVLSDSIHASTIVTNPSVTNNVAYDYTSDNANASSNVTLANLMADGTEVMAKSLNTLAKTNPTVFVNLLGLNQINASEPSYFGWTSAGHNLMESAYLITPANVWDQDSFKQSLAGSTTYGQSQDNTAAIQDAQKALDDKAKLDTAKNDLTKAQANLRPSSCCSKAS